MKYIINGLTNNIKMKEEEENNNLVTDIQVARKYINIMDSARVRNIEFNMSLKKVKQLLNTKRCYFSKEILSRIPNEPNQLTFDRIDNKKGYTDDNVVVCSYKINKLKSNLTIDEIKMLHFGINKFLKK